MKKISIFKTVLKLALIGGAGLLVACGGSSSSSDDVSTTTVDGYVVAAPVDGASVMVTDTSGNELAGPVPSASNGAYRVDVPSSNLTGDFIVESTGGSYVDEATGEPTAAGTLSAYIDGASLASGSQVQVTAASTIVHRMVVTHGMALGDALSAFELAFGFAADSSVAPANAIDPAADATDEELLAGFRMAVFSQLTADLGLSAAEQFDLLAALADDLAAGGLDGVGPTGPIAMLPVDIQSLYSLSLIAFHVSDKNATGLDNDMIGTVPFAKVALSNLYKIEYVPDTVAAMEGKTKFKLQITDKESGAGLTTPSVKLMAMMYMPAEHKHSTPDVDCAASTAEGAVEGDYDCTVYYLMASSGIDGSSAGYWALTVMAGMNDSATFYPYVMASEGDTPKIKLLAQMTGTDKIMKMDDSMMPRKYFVFKDDVSGTDDDHTFTMFVAGLESMMSYPAVSVDTVLSPKSDNPLTVSTMTVEVSTVETPVDPADWILADGSSGGGIWSAAAIPGLVDGTSGTIHVRLTINDEVKTTDGKAPGATETIINGYANFTITPPVAIQSPAQ